jgi:single-strand DNA-binding protein
MATGNEVTIVGNITRDPEVMVTPKGHSVVKLGVAWNRRWQDRDGEWQEEAHFFDVVAWGDLAENIGDSFSVGDRVIVVGRLQYETWEDRETGGKRSRVSIVADEVGASVRWATVEVFKDDDRSGTSAGRDRRGRRDSGRRRADGDRGRRRSRDDFDDDFVPGGEPF